jgi:hypothetical protein
VTSVCKKYLDILDELSNTTDCIIFHCATVVTFDAEFEQDCPLLAPFLLRAFSKVKLPRWVQQFAAQ